MPSFNKKLNQSVLPEDFTKMKKKKKQKEKKQLQQRPKRICQYSHAVTDTVSIRYN